MRDILATNADLELTKKQFFECIKAKSSIGNVGINKSLKQAKNVVPIANGGMELYY